MVRRAWIVLSLSLLIPIGLAGCGGGGGGGGGGNGGTTPTVTLSGAYGYVALTRYLSTGAVTCESGLLTADATGRLDLSAKSVVGGGTAFSPLDPADATYATGTGRSISIDGIAGVRLEGRVADDGSIAILSSRAPSSPAMCILARRSVSGDLAQLTGTWTLVSWRRLISPNVLESARGDAIINAAGDMTVNPTTYTFNVDGAIDPNAVFFGTEKFGFDTSSFFVVTFPPSTTVIRRGFLSADRNLIVLGGDTNAATLAAVTILVRKNLVSAASALLGTYHSCAFTANAGQYVNAWGSGTFDGTSNCSWTAQGNRDGTSVPEVTLPLDYGVGPDGTTDFVHSGFAANWSGGVGSAGRFAILSGSYQPGDQPSLLLFLR